MAVMFFERESRPRLAYVFTPSGKKGKSKPVVVFLGGFRSDMNGTKAVYLEERCKKNGIGFLRFDYMGHGQSDGEFTAGTIRSWAQDARDILEYVLKGQDVVLVGSSMGGWISLLLLREKNPRIKGFVGIASAPDFTLGIEAQMGKAEWYMMEEKGRLEVPTEYGEPYIFTRALLTDGRTQSLLHERHDISVPMTLIQGKQDADVPWQKALRIRDAFQGEDTDVIFIEDGDHRLSREQDLVLIGDAVEKILEEHPEKSK